MARFYTRFREVHFSPRLPLMSELCHAWGGEDSPVPAEYFVRQRAPLFLAISKLGLGGVEMNSGVPFKADL